MSSKSQRKDTVDKSPFEFYDKSIRCRPRLFAHPVAFPIFFLTFETLKLCRCRTDMFKRDVNRVGQFIRFFRLSVFTERKKRIYLLLISFSFQSNSFQEDSPNVELKSKFLNDFSRCTISEWRMIWYTLSYFDRMEYVNGVKNCHHNRNRRSENEILCSIFNAI